MHGFVVPENVPWPELDRRYFAFATSLPSPLNTLAFDRRLFRGNSESVVMNSLAELHPLVTCLPWLFDEAFPGVSQADLLAIGEAGVFLFLRMLLHDAHQDRQLGNDSGIHDLHQQLTNTALRKLQLLFAADSPFWRYHEKYLQEYAQALLLEKEHWDRIRAYPLPLMYKIGSGKVALFKTVVAAVAIKGQGEKQIERLEPALDFLAAGLQLGDDIEDWEEDYAAQNYTLPLTRVIPVEHWPNPALSTEEVRQRFDDSVVLEKLILQVMEWFNLAQEVVSELHCPHWIAFVEGCLTMTKKYQEVLVAGKLLRILKPAPAVQSIQR